jgi:hypothetical protein
MVCEQLPSPLQMSHERVEKLLASLTKPFDTLPIATQQLKNGEPASYAYIWVTFRVFIHARDNCEELLCS